MRVSGVYRFFFVAEIAAGSWILLAQAGAQEQGEEFTGINHAECTFFGPQRDHFLRGGMLESERRAQALSELTDRVAAALPPLPSRSRSGGLQIDPALAEIDRILFTAMRANGITPADPATDQEFLRRVTLDLTGRIPSARQTTTFLADPTRGKRAVLAEELLASPQWVDKWTMFFGDLFKNAARTTQVVRYPEGRDAFYRYIKSSLEENKPYDQVARELITATGTNSYEQGELNFLAGGSVSGAPVQDTYDAQAVAVAQTFLGLAHVNCLLCHDGRRHLDTLSLWGRQTKRMEAWGLASFLSHTSLLRQRAAEGSNNFIWGVVDNLTRDYPLNTTTGNRPARQPLPGQPARVAPVYPFGGGKPASAENYRLALAREVTGDLQFARATVNYIWKEFFGIGIVEPPDQFDPLRLDPNNPPPNPWTLQPSNPQLLQRLAQDFIASKYDLKALMRQIVNSRAYQLSARYSAAWNPAWDRFFARKLVRRLDAEEIHDALVESSGIPVSYNIGGLGTVQWAMQLPEPFNMPPRGPVAFLNSFLRGDRDANERSGETSVVQALSLMNDPFVLARLQVTPNSLPGANINLPDEQLVQTLYLNVLSRYPTDAEQGAALDHLRNASGTRNRRAQGLLWALYSKVDFIFNY